MISAIYKQGQKGTTGRFCTEAVATTHKQLFLNRKSCTSLEVSREYSICLSFLTFKQLNREIRFSKFQPPYPSYLLATSGAVRYIYNGVQGELAVLPDQYCYYL